MILSTKEALEWLRILSKIKKSFELIVSGTSMLPVINEGESISICGKDTYDIGDIIVFIYKQDELIVHRLLDIKENRYFCKGDNSFELEEIEGEQIIGAVLTKYDPHRTKDFISDSYEINRIFKGCNRDIGKTKLTPEYQVYYKKYLEKQS